jgi:hypothetical protein
MRDEFNILRADVDAARVPVKHHARDLTKSWFLTSREVFDERQSISATRERQNEVEEASAKNRTVRSKKTG